MHVLDQQCPRCGATDCRLATTGFFRLPAMLIGLRAIRCNRCKGKFWRFFPAVGGGGGKRRKRKSGSSAEVNVDTPSPA